MVINDNSDEGPTSTAPSVVTRQTSGCIHCDLGRPLIENTMSDRDYYPYLHRDHEGCMRICDKHSVKQDF